MIIGGGAIDNNLTKKNPKYFHQSKVKVGFEGSHSQTPYQRFGCLRFGRGGASREEFARPSGNTRKV